MGNLQSDEVDPDILKTILELGKKLQNCNNTEIKTLGDLVTNLTRAPSTLLKAPPKLLRIFQAGSERQTTNSSEDVRPWLETIKHHNQTLSLNQVDIIAPMLREWRLSEQQTKSRLSDASQWIQDPSLFWGKAPKTSDGSSIEAVINCLQYDKDYLQKDNTLLRLRHRVLREIVCLNTTYEKVRTKSRSGGIRLVTDKIATQKNIDEHERQSLYHEVKRCTTAGRRWLLLGRGVSLGIHKNVVW